MRRFLVCVGLAGCAHNVSQDRATGPDGKIKGAVPIVLDNGVAKAHGIVTYPGGDRVDWKRIVLPEGKSGKLDLTLTWKAPRPGLQVAFDVFDQWNAPIVATQAVHTKRTRSTSIDHASGAYFVRIYAPHRGDAGTYQLAASFDQDPPPPPGFDKLAIDDPPKLPAIPPPVSTCAVFDAADPVCATKCAAGAPPNWPPCIASPPPPPASPPPPHPPVMARIIKVEVVSDAVVITIAAGSEMGVERTWSGQILVDGTANPLAGGAVTIVRVTKQITVAKVKLTVDQLTNNPQVRLAP